jgi:hypothetical protein
MMLADVRRWTKQFFCSEARTLKVRREAPGKTPQTTRGGQEEMPETNPKDLVSPSRCPSSIPLFWLDSRQHLHALQ